MRCAVPCLRLVLRSVRLRCVVRGQGQRETEPMRKSTLEPMAGNEAVYMLDSVTEQTDRRLISSGEKTLKSTARMYSLGGCRGHGMAPGKESGGELGGAS